MSRNPDGGPGSGPQIDGRRSDRLATDVREMVPYYVDDWEPDEGDVGTTLLSLFAELAEEVTERLDRVPEKHRISFYDTLGFDRLPPRPARLPLSVEVADGAGENVTVPAGTVATAEPSVGPEQPFEVPADEAFDATPANLKNVFSVDPGQDAIYDHGGAIEGGEEAVLFDPEDGENVQNHAFYIADDKRLAIGPGSTLKVKIDTDADPKWLHDVLCWEFYGECEIDGETVEQWWPFPSQVSVRGTTIQGGALSHWGGLKASERFSRDFGETIPSFDPQGPTPPWIYRLGGTTTKQHENGNVVMEFAPHGTLTEKTIDGSKSKWIRCRIPKNATDRSDLFDLRFGDRRTPAPPLEVGAAADGIDPDKLLHNDVPQPTGTDSDVPQPTGTDSDDILPFGEQPRSGDTFYLASSDALTKSLAKVTITFEPGTSGNGNPVLSWEYFDGEGWSKIPDVKDYTSDFTQLNEGNENEDPKVEFDVPGDLAETTVAGHEGHWIRVRLVDGDYGEMKYVAVQDGFWFPERYDPSDADIKPPSFSSVRLSFDQTAPPDHAITENNLGCGPDFAVDKRQSYQPFERLPVDEQTLFLGFDGALRDGPINLLFDLSDAAFPASFHPRIRWEYDDPRTDEWRRPDVLDGTEGFTERGIVGLVFPNETEPTRQFGRDRHWVRARVTGEPFGVGPDVGGAGTNRVREERACGRYVETLPPAGEPRPYPPTLRGLYPNTAWARNRRTIDGEVLGSSDGSLEQTFAIANTPVVDLDIWIDELAVLSEGRRETLREQWPDRTESETDAAGDLVAFWVRWTQQPDLLDSGPEERHYILDPIAGTVSFGDGTAGKIPPRGTDNVRASYSTGGGEAGNVPEGSVSGFKQSLAFVESVTNPLAGAAGADAEPTSAVTDRAARELRDRNRAVAPADIERIAMDASRQLALARCLPAMDQSGDYSPGWVTLLVVPESAARRPTPSATLRQDIEQAVAECAPVTLVDVGQLVVRGPSYVSVSVDAEVAAAGGSISELEERARGVVQSFLHPLTGGPDGDGWPFGELPCRSDLVELLEGVDGVDHVSDLTLTFETTRSTVSVAEGEATPDTSPDALVHGGTHDLSATLADGGVS